MNPRTKRVETIQAVLIAVLAALILRQFVIAAYKIPTGSMEDTLLIGDFLLVNKFVYGAKSPEWIGIPFTQDKDWIIPTGFNVPKSLQFRLPAITRPQPYDIVVFKAPRAPNLDYIKRCIAVGGQMVRLDERDVLVDNKLFPRPPMIKFYDNIRREQGNPILVEKDHYFMMGDNRDRSSDSREWGQVPHSNIVGKPLIIYLSLSDTAQGSGLFSNVRWERLGMVVR